MEKIAKWLQNNGIDFIETENRWCKNEKWIVITLEKDCVWVNGFGEEMKFDRVIKISHMNSHMYLVTEQTGYAKFKTLSQSMSVEKTITALDKRFN